VDIEHTAGPLLTCAYTGARLPESSMVQIGGHWIAAEQKDACVQFLQQGGVLPVLPEIVGKAPPLRLIPIWKEAWRIFVPALPALLLMHLIVWLPGDLLSSYMDFEHFGEDDILRSIQFSVKLQGWIGIIAEAGCLFALGAVWRGERPQLGRTVAAGFRFWPRMWLVSFLAGLAIIFGLLLLVVPGIFFLVRYTFAGCYAVDDGRKATDALGASYRLCAGHFWVVVGVIVLTWAIATVSMFGVGFALAFLPEEWNRWEVDGIVTWFGEIPSLFLTAVIYVLWQSLREADGEEMPAMRF
jgi:hypothetical protein